MSEESQGIDPYEVVLSDLRARRDEIDQAIQALERMRGTGSTPGAISSAISSAQVPSEGPGAFLSMTIPEAAIKLLRSRKRQLNNSEIVAALQAGGLVMRSESPINTVGSVLTRRFNDVGDIVRVARGTWGLAEWYPNRSFKKKGSKGEDWADAKPETSENG